MRNYTMTALAGLALLATFAGCIPESKHPLGNLQKAEQDPQLHGLWVADQSEGETLYVHIGAEPIKGLTGGAAPEPGLMRLWAISHSSENKQVGSPDGMRFFVARVGDDQYVNLALPLDEKDTTTPRSWWFNKYRVDGATLTTWNMDFEAVGKLIEAKKVSGTVERDSEGKLKKALITAPSDEVEAFVKEHNSVLFPDKLKSTFHKISPAR